MLFDYLWVIVFGRCLCFHAATAFVRFSRFEQGSSYLCQDVSLAKCIYQRTLRKTSKHLKGQLEPPVSDEKVYVTKNEHFLKMSQEGQLRPPCQ